MRTLHQIKQVFCLLLRFNSSPSGERTDDSLHLRTGERTNISSRVLIGVQAFAEFILVQRNSFCQLFLRVGSCCILSIYFYLLLKFFQIAHNSPSLAQHSTSLHITRMLPLSVSNCNAKNSSCQ